MSSLPNIGDVLADRYRVSSLIEQAPAYTAFRVTDQEADVDVALWWMNPALFPDERRRDAFIGAVVDMRGLIHPHLRRLYDAGRHQDSTYLTTQMSSVEGMLLRLGSGRMCSEIDVVRYANAMAEALDAAHRLGHLHGWLVPWDIVQVAGQIKVSGVGLYRDIDLIAARGCWRHGERYIAPEVRETGMATPASDVYSMAAILIEIASGVSVPDLGESTEALAAEQIKLADVLAQGVAIAPDRRPPTPHDLAVRMREVMVDERIPTAERRAQRPPADAPQIGDDDATLFYEGAPTPPPELDASEGEPTTMAAPRGRRPKATNPMFGGSAASMALPLPVSDEDSAPTVLDGPEREFDSRRIPEPLPIAIGDEEGQPTAIENPAVPARGQPPPPQFVSMKPHSEPGTKGSTPVIAAIDRPGMKPVVRPIADSVRNSSVPPGSLGNYAPPRTEKAARSGVGLWLIVVLVAVAVAGAIAATFLLTGG